MKRISYWLTEVRWIDGGLLILRVTFGSGMAYHGFGKVFGGRMPGFIEVVANLGFPLPEVFAWAAGLSEFVGGILLILGLATRPASFFILCTMSVAAFGQHLHDPLREKELALVYLSAALCIFLCGSGRYGADTRIFSKTGQDKGS